MNAKRYWSLSFLLLILIALGLALYNREAIIEQVGIRGEEGELPLLLERKIRTVLELPTHEHIYHNVIYIGEEARFLGIKHLDKRLLFSIDISVQAGVDLQRGLTIEPTSTGKLRVGIPGAEILEVDADESSIREYFAKEFGGRISRLEYYDEIDRSKRRTVEDAIERGILDISNRHAKRLVERLLLSLGIEGYVYLEEEEPS